MPPSPWCSAACSRTTWCFCRDRLGRAQSVRGARTTWGASVGWRGASSRETGTMSFWQISRNFGKKNGAANGSWGARVRLYRRPGPLRRVPWWPTYMKHDGVIADHGGSAARRHRRGGNATTCLGPRMPPTISLRRAEFYVASAMPAPTLLWMVVFAPAVPSRVGRTPPRCARGASGMMLAVFTTLISGPFHRGKRRRSGRAGCTASFGRKGRHSGPSNGLTTVGRTLLDATGAAGAL